MAQERDDGIQRPPLTGDGSPDTARLRADIEETRAQMSGTIDELQERLRPEELAHRAGTAIREAVNDKVRGVVSSAETAARDVAGQARETAGHVAEQARHAAAQVADQARRHPVPASLAVGTAGWLLMRRRSGASYSDGAGLWTGLAAGALAYYAATQLLQRSDLDEGYRPYGTPHSASAVRRGMHRVRESVSEWRGTAAETADRYAEKIGETARHTGAVAKDRLVEARDIMREQGDEWRELVDRWMTENPLALGAATFALGAVAGMSLPRTAMENRALGRTRDAIVNRVQDAVDDALPR